MFDIDDGLAARDEALDRVLRRDWIWKAHIMAFIEDLPQGWTGTGEDIRHAAIDAGLSHPPHHNAWGAAIMNAVRNKKWLRWTGKVVGMKDKSSHGRLTREYVRLDEKDYDQTP